MRELRILSKKVKVFLGVIVLVMFVNINANAITYKYDLHKKTLEVEYDNGSNVKYKYKYNENNRVKEIQYDNGAKVKYKYDKYGRVVEIKYDDGSKVRYEYDKYGRLIETKVIPGHIRLVGISIEKQVYDMDINKTMNIKVIGQYSNGSFRDITDYSTFTVTNSNIVTIQNGGIITAKAYGETDLKISYLDKTCTAKINVISKGIANKPNAPKGLVAEKITQNTVNLKWNAPEDSLDLAGYDIYSGSNIVGSTDGASFLIKGLENNKEYTFKVRAKDSNGRVSNFSDEIKVKTSNAITLISISVEKERYDVDVKENIDIKVIGKYSDGSSKDVTYDSTFTATNEKIVKIQNKGVITAREYGQTDLKISYLDKTYTVKINVIDETEPSAPEELVAENVTQTTVNLKWALSTDNVGVSGYDIYSGSNLVGSTEGTNFLVNGLEPNKEYSFKVVAKDVNGNSSDFSEEVTVKTFDVVKLLDISVEKEFYDVEANETMNIKVIAKYSDGSSKDVTNDSTFTATKESIVTISNQGTVVSRNYGETALDISYLDKTCIVKINVVDKVLPSIPEGLTAEDVTQTTVNLKWALSTDNVGVAGYDIYSGSNLVGSTEGASFLVNGLDPNKAYSFKVVAKDINGNSSDFSKEINVKTLDVVKLLDISVEKEIYDVEVNETMNIKVTAKYSDGSSKDITNDSTFTATKESIVTIANQGTIVSRNYGETVLNISYLDKTCIVKINVVDKVVPSIPEGLIAEDVTQTTLNLKWAPSTDNVGVAGYDIYSGSNPVGSTESTSFLVNGLEPNKEYSFKVVAKDVNGNSSDFSKEINVKTLEVVKLLDISVEKEFYDMDVNETMNIKVIAKYSDGSSKDVTNDSTFTEVKENIITIENQGTIVTKSYGETDLNISYLDKTYIVKINVVDKVAPSSPKDLLAEDITEKTVKLIWNPSVDNAEVAGYDIYLGNDVIGSTNSTSFIVKGLEANKEYVLKVRAKDINGNLSEFSEEIKVKTLIDFTLADLSKRYNMSKGEPGWEDKYDLNNDGIIDICDIAILCRNLG